MYNEKEVKRVKEHLIIKSEFDQLPIDVTIMKPSHPKGIIQISHGMCEHKERYDDFMQYLCQQGYVCLIHDHRGHGKSVLKPDDLGYFYYQGEIGIVEDVHQLTLWIKKQYPLLPCYLFGHSMGSLVVRCYCQKYDQDIDGLFVCGSPSQNPAAGLGLLLTKIITCIKGDHYRSALIQKIGFDAFNKNFDKTTPNSWICSDKEVIKNYNQDPLCRFTFTTNGFTSLFRLMQQTYSSEHWQMKNPQLPIQFISGENDPCLTNEKKFKEAVAFMKNCGYQHVSYRLFPHMRHEILNEKKKEEVYQFILKTLKSWE
jgi:alpha-beta hydrolase superfamily lysophospholipase